MKYRIVFKGKIEDIFIDQNQANSLKHQLEQGTLGEYVTINGNLVSVAAIKAIVPIQEDDKSSSNKILTTSDQEWREYKASRLAMTPKDRSRATGFMNTINWALRGRDLTPEEVVEVQNAQEKWFKTHPHDHAANPLCYYTKEDFIKADSRLNSKRKNKEDTSQHSSALLARSVLAFGERYLSQ